MSDASGANTFTSLSPLLKEVYVKPKKQKAKSKRFDKLFKSKKSY